MQPLIDQHACHWLRTGDQALEEMLAAIEKAQTAIRLEMYIFQSDPVGERIRSALIDASQRGLHVQVLVDALGSVTLASSFWDPLKKAGADFRWFNPLTFHRFGLRDHRKVLVCDDAIAFIGGFNIGAEYLGDGILKGWRDLGMRISGAMATALASAFDEMFAMSDFRHRPFFQFQRAHAQKAIVSPNEQLLLSAPGRRNPIKRALRGDLAAARDVQIICPYFLPTWNLRNDLTRVVRRGGRVRIILPAKSDVPLSQLAGRSLYRRLLRNGVEVFEYQPQILHAKLVVIDDVAYVGSANLDARSLQINYELSVRLRGERVVEEARQIFTDTLQHCLKIHLDPWRRSRTFWIKLKERWAYFILARLDPYLTRQQVKWLRE